MKYIKLNDNLADKVEGISTGSIVFNKIITNNQDVGYVYGKVYELYGPEGCGKTTFALHGCKEYINKHKDKKVLYIDMEHAVVSKYVKNILKDELDKFLWVQPESAEEAFSNIETSVKEDNVGFVVVDSIAALTPRAVLDGNYGDNHIGQLSRFLSTYIPRLSSFVSKHKVILVCINQIRDKIGVMFGDPTTTPGGKALKFYTSCRVSLKSNKSDMKDNVHIMKISTDTIEQKKIGVDVSIEVVKNRFSEPQKKTKVYIQWGRGIDKNIDILRYLQMYKVVSKITDKTFIYKEKRYNIKDLPENKDLLNTLIKEVKNNK